MRASEIPASGIRSTRKPIKRKCSQCATRFVQVSSLHDACSLHCAIKKAEKLQAKRIAMQQKTERKEIRDRKEKLKTRSDWMSDVEKLVNMYVRLRDAKDGCISCDKGPNWYGQWHASHFLSVGSCGAMRFNTWNIHKACSVCNNFLSGNIGAYEPRLRQKIGDNKVDLLKLHPRSRTYSIEELQRYKLVFKKLIKREERRAK